MKKSVDRLSVCIETIFPFIMPYEEQIRITSSLGFQAYEFWYHDLERDGKGGWLEKENAKDFDILYRLNEELGLKLINFALNSPHTDHGGTPIDTRGTEVMMRKLERVIPICQRLEIPQLITFVGYEQPGIAKSQIMERVIDALKKINSILEDTGIILTIEPLSYPKYNGCLLPTVEDTADLLRQVDGNNIKMLYDLFHVQIMTGNIIESLAKNIDLIGHIHVSGIPGQHEPWESELNLPYILTKFKDMGYKGYFGLEYYPLQNPIESLKKTKDYLSDVEGF